MPTHIWLGSVVPQTNCPSCFTLTPSISRLSLADSQGFSVPGGTPQRTEKVGCVLREPTQASSIPLSFPFSKGKSCFLPQSFFSGPVHPSSPTTTPSELISPALPAIPASLKNEWLALHISSLVPPRAILSTLKYEPALMCWKGMYRGSLSCFWKWPTAPRNLYSCTCMLGRKCSGAACAPRAPGTRSSFSISLAGKLSRGEAVVA